VEVIRGGTRKGGERDEEGEEGKKGGKTITVKRRVYTAL
jgi:hypothetical protein